MLRRVPARAIPVAILAGLVSLGVYLWLGRGPGKTAVARMGTLSFTVSANGRLTTAEQVEVGPKVEGLVAELAVREGDLVEAGQVLARLEDREVRARLRQAESAVAVAKARLEDLRSGPRRQEKEEARAAVEAAQAQLDQANDHRARVERLFASGVVPRAELDEARRAVELRAAQLRGARERLALVEAGPRPETVEAAEAAYREAQASLAFVRTQLDNTVVRSPMTGRVIARHHERGTVVRAGEPLYTLADSTRLKVKAEVDETDLGKIRVGQSAVVTSDAFPGWKVNATIDKIAWRVGRKRMRSDNPAEIMDTKVLEVELPIEPAPEFRIGMAMDVKIHTGQKEKVLLIPRAAVQRRGPDLLVSVVTGKAVETRPVQLGAFEGQMVEVVSGLRAGEVVVVGRE